MLTFEIFLYLCCGVFWSLVEWKMFVTKVGNSRMRHINESIQRLTEITPMEQQAKLLALLNKETPRVSSNRFIVIMSILIWPIPVLWFCIEYTLKTIINKAGRNAIKKVTGVYDRITDRVWLRFEMQIEKDLKIQGCKERLSKPNS